MAPKADPSDPETITRFLCLRGGAPDELQALSLQEFNKLVMAARERLTVHQWYQFLKDNHTSILFRPAQMQVVANHQGYPITDVVPHHYFTLRETMDLGKCITIGTAHGAVNHPPAIIAPGSGVIPKTYHPTRMIVDCLCPTCRNLSVLEFMCYGCASVAYCSIACQRADLARHQGVCEQIVALVGGVSSTPTDLEI
ncbi:uncharacterized protein BDZ99DRAFT_474222 [Mytilinidion resinicola]|uniref:MYND-type domain-containing protein n=1 Tax=Mytilinidion resinicola TaxID=574789 RepID=A0A6A6YXN6_9PEZI|nr:uncharacterized protein BDZ99DRAFT_474222 [Mytilinidion resinicola]KAF2813591.1 hypothetical protein BDZ99DRAFT_474222 [Mytilinidion resinicola]